MLTIFKEEWVKDPPPRFVFWCFAVSSFRHSHQFSYAIPNALCGWRTVELETASPQKSTATRNYWDVLVCQAHSWTATADLSIYEHLVKHIFRCGLDNDGMVGRFLEGERNFSFLRNVQIRSVLRPVSNRWGPWAFLFAELNHSWRETDHLPVSTAGVKMELANVFTVANHWFLYWARWCVSITPSCFLKVPLNRDISYQI